MRRLDCLARAQPHAPRRIALTRHLSGLPHSPCAASPPPAAGRVDAPAPFWVKRAAALLDLLDLTNLLHPQPGAPDATHQAPQHTHTHTHKRTHSAMSPPTRALALLPLLLLCLATALPRAAAGGYRGRPHAPVPAELAFSANHVPAPAAKHLPKEFDW